MFDSIRILDDGYTCSEGHDLKREEFLTKDLLCDMRGFTIHDGALYDEVMESEACSGRTGKIREVTDYIHIYTTCTQCPAFLRPDNGIVFGVWVEFKVHLVGGVVMGCERVSSTTQEWLASQAKDVALKLLRGPMPQATAQAEGRAIFRRMHGLKPG